jgi:hypothetical protein
MARVTPWSPHNGARPARLRAGPGHTRVAEREDPERRCTHQRATYLQSASGSPSRAPCLDATPPENQKNQNEPGGRFGGFRTPVAHGGAFRAAESREGY